MSSAWWRCSRRRSPVGDLLYAKVYSEFYSLKKLTARYERTLAEHYAIVADTEAFRVYLAKAE